MKSSFIQRTLFLLELLYIHLGRNLGNLLASLIYFVFPNIYPMLATTLRIGLLIKTSFLHFLKKRMFGCLLTSNKHIFDFSSHNFSGCARKIGFVERIELCPPPLVILTQLRSFLSLSYCLFNYLSSLQWHNKIWFENSLSWPSKWTYWYYGQH